MRKDSKLSKFKYSLMPINANTIFVHIYEDNDQVEIKSFDRVSSRYSGTETDEVFRDRASTWAKMRLWGLNREEKRLNELRDKCSTNIFFDEEGNVVK